MPDSSEYPIREIRELPGSPIVTEIMFPDTATPDLFVGVVSSQGNDHVVGIQRIRSGRHSSVTLNADDARAMALRLLDLAVDPEAARRLLQLDRTDEDVATARREMLRMIDISMTSEQIVDRLLEHFEVFPLVED